MDFSSLQTVQVKKCGKKRIWLDPNEVSDIGMANSRFNVRKLIKDGAS